MATSKKTKKTPANANTKTASQKLASVKPAAEKPTPVAKEAAPLKTAATSPAKTEAPKTAATPASTTEAAKTAPKRRGRPVGSKNKVKKKTTTTTKTKKTSPKNTAKKTTTTNKVKTTAKPTETANFGVAFESSNIGVQAVQHITDEMVKFANDAISSNVEMSKEFLGCRTMSDMFDIQRKMMQKNIDQFFNQSTKISEMMFQAASETAEPLNTSITNSMDELTKKFVA